MSNIKIAFTNESTVLTAAEVGAAISALQKQVVTGGKKKRAERSS